MPRLYLTSGHGTREVSGLMTQMTWAGDYRQCARTLEWSMASSPSDPNIPQVDCPVGASVVMEEDGEPLFDGYIFTRTKDTGASVINLAAYDRGFYLRRNRTSRKIQDVTAEAAVEDLCRDYGIPVGNLASTGTALRRKFVDRSLYEIITELYSDAAKDTGESYHIGFEGKKLVVRAKKKGRGILLEGDTGLMNATVTESAEEVVNRVEVYDQDDNLLYASEDPGSIRQFGRMQEVVKQRAGEDASAEVQSLLKRSGVQQKITVNCLGDPRLVTGRTVVLHEPYTGLYGRFVIDTDTHRWENGVYKNTLILSLQDVSNRLSAGDD